MDEPKTVTNRDSKAGYVFVEPTDLDVVASQGFQTASGKMRKKCGPCKGTGFMVSGGRSGGGRLNFHTTVDCPDCKGAGTVGPTPLALAKAFQNGEIAELIDIVLRGKQRPHYLEALVAKIPSYSVKKEEPSAD